MSINFIHAADLHLGSRLNAVGAESKKMQKRLKNATYTAFENIVEACIREDVDFLVISGDIYDEDSRSAHANRFLADQMERLQEEGIQAYIIHGNHDPVDSGEEYFELPDNVHVLDSESSEKIRHSEEVEIIGQSYRTGHERRKMVPGFKPESSRISIGLLHTELDPENDDYVPVSMEDLEDKEVDYWALGHIHDTKVYGDNLAAYPGIPQGRHTEETGTGGCLKVELEKDSEPEIEFIPTSPLIWRKEKLDVEDTEIEKIGGLRKKISEKTENVETEIDGKPVSVTEESWSPEGLIVRWRIEGRSEVNSQLEDDEAIQALKNGLREKLSGLRPFVWTEEIKDRTRPPLPDIEDLEENEIIKEFQEMKEELSEDQEFREELKDEKAGKVWRETEEASEVREDRLALTEEKMDELIERAEKKLQDELLRRTI